jgi:hypothetical protein
LIAGSETGFTPVALVIPALGVPVAPWQLWHLAL